VSTASARLRTPPSRWPVEPMTAGAYLSSPFVVSQVRVRAGDARDVRIPSPGRVWPSTPWRQRGAPLELAASCRARSLARFERRSRPVCHHTSSCVHL
jgi:hypothetical protein